MENHQYLAVFPAASPRGTAIARLGPWGMAVNFSGAESDPIRGPNEMQIRHMPAEPIAPKRLDVPNLALRGVGL